ncbi:hypothetical protein SUGI_0116620 [Cryptomeria japonica]|nr:hypothetical protein SUGI_0116620 [Cryptomeria japonica]
MCPRLWHCNRYWHMHNNNSPIGHDIQAVGRSPHKMIEAAMQSTAKGKIQTIRQAYLSKYSSNLRANDILESINEYIDDAEMMDEMTTRSCCELKHRPGHTED